LITIQQALRQGKVLADICLSRGGNMFIMKWRGSPITGSGQRVAASYDGDPAGAPLLYVEYNTGPPTIPPVANDDAHTADEDTQLSVPAPEIPPRVSRSRRQLGT